MKVEIEIPDNIDPKLVQELVNQVSGKYSGSPCKLHQPSNDITTAIIIVGEGKKAYKMWCRVSYQSMGRVVLD